MKKLLVILVILLAINALYLSIVSLSGQQGHLYSRFKKVHGRDTTFNYWAIMSPFQTEKQTIVTNAVTFDKKVRYPLAHQFTCVSPIDTAEKAVARQIAQTIADTVHKIQVSNLFDYDDQSDAVRTASHPTTISTVSPKVVLSLFGTASPEAAKYGFENSLQPGRYEKKINCSPRPDWILLPSLFNMI